MIRAAVAAGALALAAVYVLVVRDDGLTQHTHSGEPVFTVLYDDALLDRRDGALLTLAGERKQLEVTLTVRPLRLPAYTGAVTGMLPLFAERRLPPGARVVADERARIHGAPGYELGFETGDRRTTLLFLVPDEPRPRDGVLLSLEQRQPAERDRGGGRRVALAARDALRSFQFGSERD